MEYRKNKEHKFYPIKQANRIIRIKTADGKEWLKSKQKWIGIDSQSNEVMESFSDLEVRDNPVFQYGMKPKDPKNPNGPKGHGFLGISGCSKQYDLPFDPQNLKTLYKMRPAEEAVPVTLVIQKIGYDGNSTGHPYQIEKYEDINKTIRGALGLYVDS